MCFGGCTIDKNKNPPIYGEFNIVNVTTADQAAEINKAPNLNELTNNPGSSQGGVTNKNQTKGPTSGDTTTTKRKEDSKAKDNKGANADHSKGGKGHKEDLSKEEISKRDKLSNSQNNYSKVALRNKGNSKSSSSSSNSGGGGFSNWLNGMNKVKPGDDQAVWKINEGDPGLLKEIKRGVDASARGLQKLENALNPWNWLNRK